MIGRVGKGIVQAPRVFSVTIEGRGTKKHIDYLREQWMLYSRLGQRDAARKFRGDYEKEYEKQHGRLPW